MQCASSLYVPGFDAEPAATVAALVAPADPADVSLAAGTTTSTASARTFASPTGGSGSSTLAVTIDQAVGSGAVLAGDNSSGWYLTSLEDADVVKIIGTWTDDSTGQKVAASFVTATAAATTGAAWTTLDTLAPADLANAGPFTTGTNNADYDGETIAVTTVRNGDSGDVEFVQNTGIVVTSVGGTITAGLYLNDRLPSWARAYSMFGPIAVHVPVDITFSATTDNGVVIGFNDRVTHNNGEFRGCRLRWKDASNEQFQVRTGSTDQDVGSTTTPNGTFVLTAILHAGVIVEVMRTSGTTPPTPTPGSGIAVTNGGDSVGAQATTIPFDDFYLIVNAVFSAVVTVGQLEIVRWQ